jgi:hypothetical protein
MRMERTGLHNSEDVNNNINFLGSLHSTDQKVVTNVSKEHTASFNSTEVPTLRMEVGGSLNIWLPPKYKSRMLLLHQPA